jgi:DNA polymerase-3 subunit chi
MTQIEFFHNAPDKIAAAAQLIGELYWAGRRVLVYAPSPETAARIDRQLWLQPATGFVPHCSADSALAAETPIVIGATLDDLGHDDVLVNMGGELPSAFSRFQRVVEIVDTNEEDRQPARSRFKFYRERGYALSTHDLSQH